jgi:GT2 family glycosyltransferase
MIPALGFATLSRFDLADRLLASIDYPVKDLVIVNNSGKQTWKPKKPDLVQNLWHIEVPYGLGLVGAWNLIVKSTPHAPYWLLVNDDAWFESGSLQLIAENAKPTTLSFLDITPLWSAILLGEKVVAEVGLYDERLYPLYFDDNDYQRRIENAGFVINHIPAKIYHENSSTLKSGYQHKNSQTYSANNKLFQEKVVKADYSEGNWSLKIRRENSWD